MPSDVSMISLCVPHLSGRERIYINECLDTNWVSYAGPFVDRFENELAAATDAGHAVATSSGTAALHVALWMAGVRLDDEVLMPAISFVAPANAVRYCGAWPIFTDIRGDDWQWDVDQVAEFLDSGCEMRGGKLVNRATGRNIAALLPVHLLGGMCDVDALAELSARYKVPVIEDAAECLGATYKDRPIGAAIPGFKGPLRLVITSFNGNKIITTGGGGAILSHDHKLAARAKHLTTTAKADPIAFYHDQIGFNYRMTNMAAAMGVAQLEALPTHIKRKHEIAGAYTAGLTGVDGLQAHPDPGQSRGTYWMYTVKVDQPSRPLIDALIAGGIQSRPIWVPLPSLPAFASCHCHGELSESHALHRRALSLPCSVGLSDADQNRVIHAIRAHLLHA